MRSSERDSGQRSEPIAALNVATRAYDDAVHKFRTEPDSFELMRAELRAFSAVPLVLMISRPFGKKLELFPELVLNLCQGRADGIELARNLIRTLPKSEVERLVVADLSGLVQGMTADEVTQLSDLLIELGLSTAIRKVREYARNQKDPEMRALSKDLADVELDTSRWRKSRTERIVR